MPKRKHRPAAVTRRPAPRPARRGRTLPAASAAADRPRAQSPWLDPRILELSMQRPDGEWHFCPWLTAGEDAYARDWYRLPQASEPAAVGAGRSR